MFSLSDYRRVDSQCPGPPTLLKETMAKASRRVYLCFRKETVRSEVPTFKHTQEGKTQNGKQADTRTKGERMGNRNKEEERPSSI